MRLNIKGILGSAAIASLIATTMGGGAYAAADDGGDIHEAPPEGVNLPSEVTIKFGDVLPEEAREEPTEGKGPFYYLFRFRIVDPSGDDRHVGFGSPLAVLAALFIQGAGNDGKTPLNIRRNRFDPAAGWVVSVDPKIAGLIKKMETSLGDLSKRIDGFDVDGVAELSKEHVFDKLDRTARHYYPLALGAVFDGKGGADFPKFANVEAPDDGGVTYDRRASAIFRSVCYILDPRVEKPTLGAVDLKAVNKVMTKQGITINNERLREVLDAVTENGWTEMMEEFLGGGEHTEDPPDDEDEDVAEAKSVETIFGEVKTADPRLAGKADELSTGITSSVEGLQTGLGTLSPGEKEKIAELLGECFGAHQEAIEFLGGVVVEQSDAIDNLRQEVAAAASASKKGAAADPVAAQRLKDLEEQNENVAAALKEEKAKTAAALKEERAKTTELEKLKKRYGALEERYAGIERERDEALRDAQQKAEELAHIQEEMASTADEDVVAGLREKNEELAEENEGLTEQVKNLKAEIGRLKLAGAKGTTSTSSPKSGETRPGRKRLYEGESAKPEPSPAPPPKPRETQSPSGNPPPRQTQSKRKRVVF